MKEAGEEGSRGPKFKVFKKYVEDMNEIKKEINKQGGKRRMSHMIQMNSRAPKSTRNARSSHSNPLDGSGSDGAEILSNRGSGKGHVSPNPASGRFNFNVE